MARLRAGIGAVLAVSIIVAAAGAGPAKSDETGFASMHEWKRVGKLICFVDHAHYGSSAGHRDKKSATAAAIKDWAGFTAFEYGTTWANFNKATGKKIGCTQSSGGWGCEIEARPCR